MKNLNFSTIVLILTLLFGCDYANNNVKRVYKDKAFIIREFSNYSIIRSRGKNIIILDKYEDELKNRFFFQKEKKNKYLLIKDSIEYDKETLKDRIIYDKQLTSLLEKKIQIMDNYNIRDISCEFRNQGIDMKIYFNSLDVLLYVSDSEVVKNEEWVKYLKTLKKMDDNWYYEINQ